MLVCLLTLNITIVNTIEGTGEHIIDEQVPDDQYMGGRNNELEREITSETEAKYLNDKEDGYWRVGCKTYKFNNIEQIHEELKKKFGDHTIVTYYERRLFKNMLYFKDGENLGIAHFGEVWSDTPTSVYKHLLPDYKDIKIKCEDCGHEYKIEDITYEKPWVDNTILVTFYKKYEVNNRCCKYYQLMWNVVL